MSTTYLLIDGENLDTTLGQNVLSRKPNPDERPRWERVLSFAEKAYDSPVKALFFMNASNGTMPMAFVQALTAIGLRPVPLSGPPGMKVVDVGIEKMLDAIATTEANVLLASHDGDFLPKVSGLLDGGHRVGLLAFREFVNARYADLVPRGLTVFDLEDDAKAFTHVLPRLRIIDIEQFDAAAYL